MMDLQTYTQETLDGVLLKDEIRSFWQRRLPGTDDCPPMYVVYTITGGGTEASADNAPVVISSNITVRVYYKIDLLGSKWGRTLIKSAVSDIMAAMRKAGFFAPDGPFEVGEIDGRIRADIGYNATVIEFYYYEVI